MKRHFITVLLTAWGAVACGGGSGSEFDNSCGFEFSSITNGASAKQADSYWACQDAEGSYDLAFFDDGSGVISTIGALTWQEGACGQAVAQTSGGELSVEQIQGTAASATMTFLARSSVSGESSNNSCFLVALENISEIAEAPPQAPPSEGAPQGEGDDEEILSEPAQNGGVYFIFAQDGAFLGFVNDNRFDSDSLCNRFGSYGNKFSGFSMWNAFGSYGGDFGAFSSFNSLSSSPPILFDEVGALAYVTTNPAMSPRVDAFYLLGILQSAGCEVER